MYYLHYISWACFNTFHASCTKRVIDSRRTPFLDCVFLTSIYAVETLTTFSDYRYVDVIVEFVFLHFS